MRPQASPAMPRFAVRAVLSMAWLLAVLSPLMAATIEPVRTEAGLVSGVPGRDPSVTVYKGVPYAAPPVGDLRWRAPQPPRPWQGVRKADTFGSFCPQMLPPQALLRPEWTFNEDCLFLNIWTKAASASEKRPVMVWLHGGRFIFGSGAEPRFDGEGLARKGVVAVTMNYRLGVFGFLATPELSKESGHNASGNWGLLDQIACLQWIRNNIAAFGGDPDRVTIFGQSAGGGSVLLLCSSPLAKGLYHRAICESGARFPSDPDLRRLSVSWRPLEDAETAGAHYAEAHGARSLQELRALSWDQLKDRNNANDETVRGGTPPPPLFRPAVDGWVIPLNYSQTYGRGLQNDVPIINGHETGSPARPVTLEAYRNAAKEKYGVMADEFLKLHPASSDDEATLATKTAQIDGTRISSFLWATEWKKAAKNEVYTFTWTHAPPGPDRERRGAYHESEIDYVFNSLYATDKPWQDEDRKIAGIMSSYWANFAATGNPNGKDLPAWPAFAPTSPQTMELGARFEPIPVADPEKVEFFRRFFSTQDAW
jgi:para-nitrobenzyl esterase